MPDTATLSVTLPAKLLTQVQKAVADGEFTSSSEIVQYALEYWSASRSTPLSDDALRAAWQESLDHGGPYVPMDEVMDRLEVKYRAIAAGERQL